MQVWRKIEDIIKWVLNKDDLSKLEYGSFDEDVLFNTIKQHRLEFLTQNKILHGENKMFSEGFINKLNAQCLAIQQLCKEQRAFFSKLNHSFSKETYLPIAIKGMTGYALINESSMQRRSNDIDIFYPDTKLLTEKIIALPLGDCEINTNCSQHEYVKLNINNIYIEVHNSFPVIRLPPIVRVNKYNQPFSQEIELTELTYFDLYENSILSETKECKGLRVTNLELSVLISCAHIYKDYLWEPFKFPRVKLIEVYEAYNFASNNKFDKDRFVKLIAKFNAGQAVSFVSKIMDVFYGEKNPFRFLNMDILPYYKIMNTYFSPYIQSNDDLYFEKLPFTNFDDILNGLNPNIIETGRSYLTKNFESVYKCSLTDRFSDFELTIVFENDILTCKFFIDEKFEAGDNVIIRYEGGQAHLRIYEKTEDYKFFGSGTYVVTQKENGYFVELNIPFLNKNKVINCMAALEKYYENGKSVSSIPLKITM